MSTTESIANLRKARDLFLEALAFDSLSERREFVERACLGDEAILQNVLDLLAAHESTSSFMCSPVVDRLGSLAEFDEGFVEPIMPGDVIDRYQILELIGKGGMGCVFKAQQIQTVSRTVALKVVRAGLTSRTTVKMFEEERQTLALMSHPGIVGVLDAGETTDGRPYFVMEYVDGRPLTQFCTINQTCLEERLKIMIRICDAVQHAHGRGIIHQDLKPANILVSHVDGKPSAKLIDFGVQTRIPDSVAAVKNQPVCGTPQYMSPELKTGAVRRPEIRSDVYSLGVILSEVLACKPIEAKAIQPGQKRVVTGAKEKTLSKWRWQELGWIVSRATNELPEGRYQTVFALSEDLQRFLDAVPVAAAPQSPAYRARKFAGHHWISIVLVALVMLTLTLGLSISLHLTRLAREATVQSETHLKSSRTQQARYQKLAWESTIQQAYEAWDESNLHVAHEYLEQLLRTEPGAQSRPEWRLLRGLLRDRFQVSSISNRSLTEIQRRPRHDEIVVASADGQIRRLNSRTGQIIGTIPTEIPEIHSLALSHDGSLVAAGGTTDNKTDHSQMMLFEVDSGTLRKKFPPQQTTIESIQFSFDDQHLICGPRYHDVSVFDVSHGTLTKTIRNDRRNRWLPASDNGSELLIEEATNMIRLESTQPGYVPRLMVMPEFHETAFWLPAINSFVAVLNGQNAMPLMRLPDGKIIGLLKGSGSANCLRFVTETSEVIVGTQRGEIISWTLQPVIQHLLNDVPHRLSETVVYEQLVPMLEAVRRVRISGVPLLSVDGDAGVIFAGDDSGRLFRVDGSPTGLKSASEPQLPDMTSFIWDEHRQLLWSGHDDGSVKNWTFNAGASTSPVTPTQLTLNAIVLDPISSTGQQESTIQKAAAVQLHCISSNGEKLAYLDASASEVVVKDLQSDRELCIPASDLSDEEASIQAMTFSPDGDRLAVCGRRYAAVANLQAQPPRITRTQLGGVSETIVWLDRDQRVLIGGELHGLVQWDTGSQEKKTIRFAGTNTSAFGNKTHKGVVYSGHVDGSVRSWIVEHGTLREQWHTPLHEHAVEHIYVRETDGIGASVDRSGRIGLWWLDSGRKIGMLNRVPPLDKRAHWITAVIGFSSNREWLLFLQRDNEDLLLDIWSELK